MSEARAASALFASSRAHTAPRRASNASDRGRSTVNCSGFTDHSRVNSHSSAGVSSSSSGDRRRRVVLGRRNGTRKISSTLSRTRAAAEGTEKGDAGAAGGDCAAITDWSFVDPDYLYGTIEDKLDYLNDFERSEVYAATELAYKAHDGQKRKSGEPFISHPVAVAGILADQHMDHETVVAGLLHDTVEDTDHVTFESIQDRFGPAVRRIVEGETKVSKVSSSVSKQVPGEGPADVANADLQQMFLAMTQEVRVIIVKLADRLHNMRTLGSLKPEKRVRIANETLLVFAPLAKLLGMYQIKNELEDLAFRWSTPEYHAETARWFDELSKRQEPVVRSAAEELQALCDADEFLKSACTRVEVQPRAKEFYGVFRKAGGGMGKVAAGAPGEERSRGGSKGSSSSSSSSTSSPSSRTSGGAVGTSSGEGASGEEVPGEGITDSLRRVNEVAQLRVVLHLKDPSSKLDSSRVCCYHVLGMVHAMWPPVPGRMKDYIATPKLNGYRALHTVVLPIGTEQQQHQQQQESEEGEEGSGGGGGGGGSGGGGEHEVFPLELQIRTEDMHRMAEYGISADREVKAAWRTMAVRTGKKLRRHRAKNGNASGTGDLNGGGSSSSASDRGAVAAAAASLGASDSSDSEDSDSDDEDEEEEEGESISPEESLLIRTGHSRQVEWLSNIREWQEEFLGVLTAEEFVDTVTGDLLGRRVFVFTPSGGVMNLPHGSTVVDYAFYNDVGLDMVQAKVNGVAVEPDFTLSNADVVEILTQKNSGLEIASGMGGAAAAAVAGAVTKQKVALQKKFLKIARTRSAKYKIQKFLMEQGAMPGASSPLSAAPSSDLDIIDDGKKNEAVASAARIMISEAVAATSAPASSSSSSDDGSKSVSVVSITRKFSTAMLWLRCKDRDGLLADISDIITKVGGCSIIGYSGSAVDGAKSEFGMKYTMQFDPNGHLFDGLAGGGSGEKEGAAAVELAEQRLTELDSRMIMLHRELRLNDAVLETRLFCNVDIQGKKEN